jgi:hypothetical protein
MCNIEYPIFLGCKDYTNDLFWKQIFNDLSRGKSPRGVRITSESLTCCYKDKDFNYEYKGNKCKNVYIQVYNLFTKRLNIYSQKDQYNRRKEMDSLVEEMQENKKEKWSAIRKKATRYNLILGYASRMKKLHNTDVSTAKRLISTIFSGLSFKDILSSDVEYHGGKIYNIKVIYFDGVNFLIDKTSECQMKKAVKKKESIIADQWNKYIAKLEKNIFYTHQPDKENNDDDNVKDIDDL